MLGNFGSPKAMRFSSSRGTKRLARLRSPLLRPFEEDGHALTEADAEGRESDFRPARLHGVHERDGDAGAARADRMAERDGPAEHVHARRIEIEPAFAGDRLRGERFVQ